MMATPIPSYTEIDPAVFEAINPSQFIRFTVPNTLNRRYLLNDPVLHVSVCDSPLADPDDDDDRPIIAALIVPKGREKDWNYATEFGHMQLLYKFPCVSRLIQIANSGPDRRTSVYKSPPFTYTEEQYSLENELKPLLIPLHPKVSCTSYNGSPKTYFFIEAHDMAYRVTSQYYLCPIVGAILVEDVELVGNRQLCRRMRFRRMPYTVQSEAILVPIIGDKKGTPQIGLERLKKIENIEFEADTSVLVHLYLIPMVSGLSVIASHLNERIQLGFTPRALCLGIGGGVLLSFLNTQLGFEVTGVEVDKVVLTAATQHFAFNKSGSIRVIVGDAIEVIQNFPPQKPKGDTDESKGDKFDVIFVDLDSSEAKYGYSAPPPEFIKKPVFEGLRLLLDDHGVLIINVVPLDETLYTLLKELQEVFPKVYDINVENKGDHVFMAAVSPTPSADNDNEFLNKLKSVIPGTYMDSIVEF